MKKKLLFDYCIGPVITLVLVTLLGYGLVLMPEPYNTSGDFTNIGMIYLVAVVFTALRWGLFPSLITAISGFLLYQFMFRDNANIWLTNSREMVNLLVFMSASMIAALIGSRSRQELTQKRWEIAFHKERLEKEREELRSALLASVTHDLRTPLSSVIGSLSSVRFVSSLGEQAREQLIVTAHEEAVRLNGFISNILNMTRLEAGSIHMEKDWHFPAAIVHRVLKRMQPRIYHRRVIVNAPKSHLQFAMDGNLMDQVIQNLVDNALKYGKPDTPITIDIEELDGLGIIAVSNEGRGIPRQYEKKIFDKFYRSAKRDSTIAGVGLGLSICDAIMKIHGGTITVSSPYPEREEKGTRFTLTFPQIRRLHYAITTKEESLAQGTG